MGADISHDAAIAAVAVRQHGNVTRARLLDLGLTEKAIVHRARTGRLYRVYPGVYAVGRPPRTPLERASAAVLACGPNAALSHGSAMSLWGFWNRWDIPFEVTVPTHRRPKRITAHRSRTLLPRDIRHHHGIWVTSPARTLLDIVARLNDRQRKRAIKNALVSPYLTQSQLADLLTRHPHHPATKLLTPFVALSAKRLNSGLEVDAVQWCAQWDLPIPLTNISIGGYTADFYFPDHGLILEIDSPEYHLNPVSFETDRERDTDTLLAGFPTVRLTPERMTTNPQQEAERLRRILDQLAARRRPRKGFAK